MKRLYPSFCERLQPTVLALFISLTVFFPSLVSADITEQIASTRQQLDALDADNPANSKQREIYQQTLSALQETKRLESRVTRLRDNLAKLPADIEKLQAQLAAPEPAVAAKNWRSQPLEKLENRLTPAQANLLALEQQFNTLDNQVSNYQDKATSLRNQLTKLKQTTTLPGSGENGSQTLTEARFALNNTRIQAFELEILNIPSQREFDLLQLELLSRKITAHKAYLQELQDLIQTKRRIEAEQALKALKTAPSDEDYPKALQPIVKGNHTLSEKLRHSLQSSEQAIAQRRTLERQQSLLRQSYKAIEQQLELTDTTFSLELKQLSERFATAQDTEPNRQRINQVRLANLELNQQALNQAFSATDLSPEDQQSAAQLLDDMEGLTARLETAYAQELDERSKLLGVQNDINKQIEQGQALLERYLIWLPNTTEINRRFLQDIGDSFTAIQQHSQQLISNSQINASGAWLRSLFTLLVLSIISMYSFRYLISHEQQWAEELGNVVKDKFTRSLRLLLLAPVISLPVPAGLWFLTQKLIAVPAPVMQPMSISLSLLVWAYLSLLLWLRRPYGLLYRHLDVPEELCATLARIAHPLYLIGIPLTLALIYLTGIPSTEVHSGLGRIVFILLALLAGGFWAALWRVAPQINEATETRRWWQRARLWLAILVLIHGVLIAEALLGYVLTGGIIMLLLLITTMIFFSVFTFYRLGMRWLLIEERRLAFDRARARRSEILEARENNTEVPPVQEDFLNLSTISDQAKVLLKATSVSLLFVALWLLFKEFIPALQILDEIVLWSNTVVTSGGVIAENITLLGIITGLLVISLSILAAYNLPGLLELLVLKHLDLTPGTSYAVTTITKYSLIVVSILAGASQIGVEWAKLQWLVAALGVGLGFGLQEIVANFVSGIIILFEKPIRIGDTVTVGGLTGTVTRIQIRATTITDWDRKEVIIPNKTFVTDQLINWSLSDPITRVVIQVGVAYGSDTDLVRALILQAARNHPKVLQEPQPAAYFHAFGDSTLNFDLRLYLNNLDDRLPVTHDILQQINADFEKHDICIAFPQLDVRLIKSDDDK